MREGEGYGFAGVYSPGIYFAREHACCMSAGVATERASRVYTDGGVVGSHRPMASTSARPNSRNQGLSWARTQKRRTKLAMTIAPETIDLKSSDITGNTYHTNTRQHKRSQTHTHRYTDTRKTEGGSATTHLIQELPVVRYQEQRLGVRLSNKCAGDMVASGVGRSESGKTWEATPRKNERRWVNEDPTETTTFRVGS